MDRAGKCADLFTSRIKMKMGNEEKRGGETLSYPADSDFAGAIQMLRTGAMEIQQICREPSETPNACKMGHADINDSFKSDGSVFGRYGVLAL